MASAASMSMALAAQNRVSPFWASDAFLKPGGMKKLKPHVNHSTKVQCMPNVEASLKGTAVARITTVGFAASLVIPEVAQAADSLTPSLQNFLLSIAAGGVVLVAIAGAVIGVSNFDPIKRT